MFCKKCGHRLADGETVCPKCGTQLSGKKPQGSAKSDKKHKAGPRQEHGSFSSMLPGRSRKLEDKKVERTKPQSAAAEQAPTEQPGPAESTRVMSEAAQNERASAPKQPVSELAIGHPDAPEIEVTEPIASGEIDVREPREASTFAASSDHAGEQKAAGHESGAARDTFEQPTVVLPSASDPHKATATEPSLASEPERNITGAAQLSKAAGSQKPAANPFAGGAGKRRLIIVSTVLAVLVVAILLVVLILGKSASSNAGQSDVNEPAQEQVAREDDSADDSSKDEVATVSVPNVLGMDESDAKAQLESMGLVVGEVSEDYSSRVEAGSVIAQSPAGGSTADEGDEVTLMVSKGSKEANVEHRYTLVQSAVTWDAAEAYCEDQDGYLATITSVDEMNQVLGLLPSEGTVLAWIGGMRVGDSWQWVNGDDFSYTCWGAGEPNNDDGNENRLALLKVNGSWSWYDVPNDVTGIYSPSKLAFIMEQEVETY